MTADDTVRVQVPFSKREVELTRAEWMACRRIENLVAVLALSLGSVLFVAGLSVSGLSPIGVLIVIGAALFYFDGTVARLWAGKKGRNLSD